MAATRSKSIGGLLAAATASLLGQNAESAEVYGNNWSVDASYLSYSEEDRVDVESYMIDVRGDMSDRDSIKLGVVLDTMTGSTHTGAVQTSSVTTVTGTSGAGFTTSGEAKALAPFEDTRLAVDMAWTHDFWRTFRVRPNAYVSVESDYEALGGGITAEKDFFNKQTTLSLAFGGSTDKIAQLDGRTPVPGSDTADEDFAGEGRRETLDGVIGITHAVNPKTLMQLNLFYTVSEGYHTDPYKVVSVANENDIELTRIYESRPTERRRKGLFASLVHELRADRDTLALDYRYYTDGWGIDSHTVNLRYRYQLGSERFFLEPFGRYYRQTAADFYVRNLATGESVPRYVSADNRLARLRSTTYGMKLGVPLGQGGILKLRAFRFEQRMKNAVFGENNATAYQITYTKDFQ
ncbi:DUF3570 domain-containing protein [Thiohalorhabdus sp. Cl-TMA]|uniref:DUF3570 domain-containing protein n=1 Tax=Thiohalorhabdus methylotrophus TaxID=3242694 RepID=A0ABV4TY03_9GAMM